MSQKTKKPATPIKTVFLSSTGRDLAEHRGAAYKAIESLDGYHCLPMENFGARDREADDFCCERVAECDLFVGIAGHCYGSCPKGSEQSFTEREYEAAVNANKPRLMFIAPDHFSLSMNLRESDEKWQKQRVFRQRVNNEPMHDIFTSPDDLACRIVQAIRNWEQECLKPKARPEAACVEIPMPLPPEPYFVHSLDLANHFAGRVDERRQLTEWLTEQGEHGNEAVLVLRAIGGMGKSSVAWVWVRRDVAGVSVSGLPDDPPEVQSKLRVPEERKPEGILWYSFYEGGGTFQGFLQKAIAYCSGGGRTVDDYAIQTQEGPSTDFGKMQEDLTQLLQQRRFLLVWDGAERLLREYACVDAAVREERKPEEMEPEARDVVDPSARRFLKDMAAQSSSQMLLTTRLFPRDLEKSAGASERELTGLGEEHSVAYLQAQGIRGDPSALASAAEQYEFHPLSLSNLAADLRRDFEDEGNIAGAMRHDQTENLKARRDHILKRAYERRAPHRRELLSRMAAMRGTIPKDVVRLLAEDIPGLELKTLGEDLDELVRHGLLRHPTPDRYGFHPIVRRFCYQRLTNKEAIHRRLTEHYVEYFKNNQPPQKITSIEDLAQLIEFYHHTINVRLYNQALRLYRDYLDRPLRYQLGAYQTIVELLELIHDREDWPQRLITGKEQAWILEALAVAVDSCGACHRSMELKQAASFIYQDLKEPLLFWTSRTRIAIDKRKLGMIADAKSILTEAIRQFRKMIPRPGRNRATFERAYAHYLLARALSISGEFASADQQAEVSRRIFRNRFHNQKQPLCLVRCCQTENALLAGDSQSAFRRACEAFEHWERHAKARYADQGNRTRVEWLLGWATAALARDKPDDRNELLERSEKHLTEALTRCRRINMVDHEPDILLAWARWHRLKGNKKEAKENAEEALSIAYRCEYRLKQADIHNFLAQLALDEKDHPTARKHAEIAKERAWCDGPPHYYKPAYEEAERLLKEAGGD